MIEKLNGVSDMMTNNKGAHVPNILFDEYNNEMLDNVRPMKWVDPKIDGNDKYDMLVIGAGAAGLTAAAGSSGLGARACMIE